MFSSRQPTMVTPDRALRGRERPGFSVPDRHEVLGTPLKPPFPDGLQTAVFGLGCFWGAERLRSRESQLQRPAESLLGIAQSYSGDAPGQRRRNPVSLGDLLDQ